MNSGKHIVMLGTSFHTMGGISAVVNEYRQAGLFDRLPIIYIATHCDGSMAKKLQFCVTSWFRYVALLLQRKVVLIHVHMASNASFWRKGLFFLPAFLCHIPTILHLHGGGFSRFYERDCNRTVKWLVRYMFDRVDSVIVLSNHWQCWVKSISSNSRILPIANPVQLPPTIDFFLREPSTILFLGRLGEQKGTYDLLNAVSGLVTQYPNLTLLLGGDGELDRVQKQANQMGIGAHVEVLGWISVTRKSALLRRAAIYVLPSYAEGLPMSVLEAMAAGLPVISTRVGGIPEVIADGLEGYLIQPGDVIALSNALNMLLVDADLRRSMGIAARNKVESTFSTEHVLPQIERLYQDLGIQT